MACKKEQKMSDGLSHLQRDSDRTSAFSDFLICLAVYLEKPTKKNKKEIEKIAKKCDNISMGYWSGSTALTKNLDEWINLIEKNDEEAWLKLLISARRARTTSSLYIDFYFKWEITIYEKLKSLSPFKDKLMFSLSYGPNHHAIDFLDIEIVDDYLKSKKMATYNGDNYILFFDKKNLDKIKWINHRIYDDPFIKNRKK